MAQVTIVVTDKGDGSIDVQVAAFPHLDVDRPMVGSGAHQVGSALIKHLQSLLNAGPQIQIARTLPGH